MQVIVRIESAILRECIDRAIRQMLVDIGGTRVTERGMTKHVEHVVNLVMSVAERDVGDAPPDFTTSQELAIEKARSLANAYRTMARSLDRVLGESGADGGAAREVHHIATSALGATAQLAELVGAAFGGGK